MPTAGLCLCQRSGYVCVWHGACENWRPSSLWLCTDHNDCLAWCDIARDTQVRPCIRAAGGEIAPGHHSLPSDVRHRGEPKEQNLPARIRMMVLGHLARPINCTNYRHNRSHEPTDYCGGGPGKNCLPKAVSACRI